MFGKLPCLNASLKTFCNASSKNFSWYITRCSCLIWIYLPQFSLNFTCRNLFQWKVVDIFYLLFHWQDTGVIFYVFIHLSTHSVILEWESAIYKFSLIFRVFAAFRKKLFASSDTNYHQIWCFLHYPQELFCF